MKNIRNQDALDGGKKATVANPSTTNVRRKPGRPRGADSGSVNGEAIIRTGYKLTKTVNLQDISIVLVARTLGVAATLIHYYIGGRDQLTSSIMNRFYKDLLRKLPQATGLWESDLIQASWAMYRHFIACPGVAAYMLQHNRFRTFQLTDDIDEDYGIHVLERFTMLVMQSGCSPDRAGIYSHLIRDFILSSAHSAAGSRYPAAHKDFLQKKVAALQATNYPAIHATMASQLELDAEASFREGCHLFIVGLREPEMQAAAMSAHARTARSAAK